MPNRAGGVFLALAAGTSVGVAGVCRAQSKVEFRIVERTGQGVVSPSDAVLNLAVQGRVLDSTSKVGIGGFTFAIILNGESPAFGTLARDPISNPDGTYFSGITGQPSGSTNGVARQYAYLVGINAAFNGLINASGGGWTQTPSQDIGLIAGFSAQSRLLGTPGVDEDYDGTPDAAVGAEAILPAQIMQSYFGAGGVWIDLYRFRYTVNNFGARELDLHLVSTSSDPNPSAFTFTRLEFTNNTWGMVSTSTSVLPGDITGLKLDVVPGPGSGVGVGVLLLGAAGIQRRRRG
ncbi:MAG TPA: hypothetical protein PKE29_07685 [Phycisphaerales bacterium]|nr:hypothetical protein [Phycisphaerales bacterium]